MARAFIIAEAGVNHNGNIDTAKRMVDAAAAAGADAVKFQTFRAEKIVSASAPKAAYQKKISSGGESQLNMLKKLELGADHFKELATYCRCKGIIFLSAAFDLESIDLLDAMGMETFKIPSGEITNLPYLRKMGSLKKNIIMSTGMSDLNEVRAALEVLTGCGTPRDRITILHCNTEYPTPMEDVNLLAMLTLKEALGLKVGYSDHTAGIEVPIAAAALGAAVIEKHFTLDRMMEGPDHKASLEPEELKSMVSAIRNIEKAMGSAAKMSSPSESRNMAVVRKSLVASRDIKKGEIFTEENITTKRPGSGISPMKWDSVIGKAAKKDFRRDEEIVL